MSNTVFQTQTIKVRVKDNGSLQSTTPVTLKNAIGQKRSLTELFDVQIVDLANSQILAYQANNSQWINRNPTTIVGNIGQIVVANTNAFDFALGLANNVIANNIQVGSQLTVNSSGAYVNTGYINNGFFGNVTISNATILTGSLQLRDIIPDANNVYTIGNNTNRFATLYLSGNTLYMGNVVFEDTNTSLGLKTSNGSPISVSMGNTTVNGSLDVSAAFRAESLQANTLTIYKTSNLVGNVAIGGILRVANNTEIVGNLQIDGTINRNPNINIILTGDVTGTGNATMADLTSVTISINTTSQGNSIQLGVDTFGSYVANIANGTGVFISNTAGGETEVPVIAIGQDVRTNSTVTFASANVTGDIRANNIIIGNGSITAAAPLTIGFAVGANGPGSGIKVGETEFFAFSATGSNRGAPTFRSAIANSQTVLRVLPNGTPSPNDFTTQTQFEFFSVDYFSNTTNWHNLRIIAQPNRFVIDTARQANTDSPKPIVFDIGGQGSSNATNANYPGVLVLSADGRVGVNNQAPDAQFAVTGTANVSGNVRIGGTLTVANAFSVGNTTITGFANVVGNLQVTDTITGNNMTLSGNLTVSGTTTYINTTALNVGDNIITLNADVPNVTAPTENAGIEINRGSSANVSFLWDETLDTWSQGNTTVAGYVNASSINVTGSATVNGALTVNNTASFGNTTITGFANVVGNVNITNTLTSANLFANALSTNTFTTNLISVTISPSNATIAPTTGITGWNYSGKFKSVATEESNPTGLFFSPDGLNMYVNGTTGDDVNQYTLSTAWDVSTASYVRVFSTAAQDSTPNDIFFKPDGLSMFILGQTNDTVFQYTLSSAFDISTASYASKSFSVTTQETLPSGLWFKPDGTVMYVIGSATDTVYQYNLGTAWDVSTASYASISFSVASQESIPQQVNLSADGTKMWIVGSTGDDINEYNLATPWNVSTATFVNNFYVGFQDTSPTGLFIDSTAANRVYIVGQTNDAVYQYNTATNSISADTDVFNTTSNARIQGNLAVQSNAYVDGAITTQGGVTAGGTGSFNGLSSSGTTTLATSTATQTVSLGAGATTSGSTKTMNIGTAGVSGSITNINIGSAVSGATSNTLLYSNTFIVTGGNTYLGGLIGGESFRVIPTVNSNNYLQVAGAVTGAGPTLSAQGVDTNIGINITGKGTGVVNISPSINVPGSATVNGALVVNNTASFGNTTVTGFVNATSSVNSAILSVGTSFIANTLGAYHTGTVNAASLTVGTSFVANSVGATTTGYANVGGRILGNLGGADANTFTGVGLDINSAVIRVGDAQNILTMANGTGFKIHHSGNAHKSIGQLGNTFYISDTSTDGNSLFPATRTDIFAANTSLATLGVNTSITGFVNVSSTANVGGAITARGNVTVNGALVVANTASLGNTTVTGFINVSSTANIGGAITARSDVTVNGALTVANTAALGNTTITGDATVTSNLTANNIRTTGSMQIDGNLTVSGNSIIINATDLAISDNIIYLNEPETDTITSATSNGSAFLYTSNNTLSPGLVVTITGINPSGYNVVANTITFANATHFAIANTTSPGAYVSGGTAVAQVSTNPDVGFVANYNDGVYRHAGFFRDATDGVFKVFDNFEVEPNGAFIDTSNNTFRIADFQSNNTLLGTANVAGTTRIGTGLANYIQLAGSATSNWTTLSTQGTDTNIDISYFTKGSGNHTFSSGGVNNNIQFRVAHTASSVNYLQATGAATGGGVAISSQGSDTNINLFYQTKGTGGHVFYTNAGVSGRQVDILHTASAANRLTLTGAIAGAGPRISVDGSDTNTDLILAAKGTGGIHLQTSGANAVSIFSVASADIPLIMLPGRTGVSGAILKGLDLQFGATTGSINFNTNMGSGSGIGTKQFTVTHTASAVNFLQATGSVTGAGPTLSAQGSDANVALNITAKASANINLNSNTNFAANTLTFTGSAGSNTSIALRVLNDGVLSFEGGAGQLFSIANSLTGQIFAVNDISGIPSIEVYSNGQVNIARFGGNVSIGTSTSTITVNGSVTFGNTLTLANNLTVTGFVNATASVNSAVLSVGTSFIANTLGAYHTGVVNAATLSIGTAVVANSSGVTTTGFANVGTTLSVGANVIANTTALFVGNSTVNTVITQNTLQVANATGNTLLVAANGNIGIGNSTPGSKLVVQGSARVDGAVSIGGSGRIEVDAPNYVGGRLTITTDPTGNSTNFSPNANVGIGNSAPAHKLRVEGNASITSSLNVGTTFASGNATITGFANVVGNLQVTDTLTGNNLTLSGNLTVSGTTTYINTTTLNIGDNIVTLNADLGAVAPTENAGIEINRGSSANVSFLWNETNDYWDISNTNVTGFVNATSSVNSAIISVGTNFVANTLGAYHTGTVNGAVISVGTAVIANTTGVTTTGFVNATSSVNSALLTVGTNFIANTIGAYHTGTINAASHTVGTAFIANSTGVTTTGFVNATSSVNSAVLSVGTSFIANTTGAYHTGTINAASFTTTTVTANTTAISVGANVIANTTAVFVGNSTVNTVITQNTLQVANATGTSLFVAANGNIGIGNNTPGSRLTIAAGTPGSITIGAWGANYNAINLNGNNVGGASGGDYNILGDASSLFINRFSGSMYFRLNNNDQMFLSSNGNFGIGNNAPAQKLVVNGTANVTGTLTHGGLVMSTGTGIDQIFTATPSLTLNTTWQSTGVTSTSLANGTYIVQLLANDVAAGGTANNEYYSGIMSWYSADTNSTILDEIPLHRSGVAGSNNAIFLATQRTATANTSDLILMISSAANNTSASTYTLRFRRMI